MNEFPKFSKIEEIIYHLPPQLVPGQVDPLQKLGFSELKEDIYLVNYWKYHKIMYGVEYVHNWWFRNKSFLVGSIALMSWEHVTIHYV